MERKAYWVGFNLVRGIGAVRLRGLLDFFGSLEIAWQAPVDALQAAGLSGKIIENFLAVRKGVDLERVWDRIQAQGIHVMTWDDAGLSAPPEGDRPAAAGAVRARRNSG